MFRKVWNNKFKGLFGFCVILLNTIIKRTSDLICQIGFLNNINKSGKGCKVLRGLYYRYPDCIKIGNNIIIAEDCSLISESTLNIKTANLIIKDNVSIGRRCEIDFSGGVYINCNAHIAHDVMIITHDHGYQYSSVPIGKPLIIGENAFIGNRVVVLFNCNYIGNNSVIGTGSVVTKDVPDNVVVAGNPAKIICSVDDINTKN